MNKETDERLLLDRAARLPREMSPNQDLWPAIESQLGEQRTDQPQAEDETAGPARVAFIHRWRAPAALAASLLLAVFLGYWAGREDTAAPAPAPVAAAPTDAVLQPVSLVEEVGLLEARRAMAAEIETGLVSLPADARMVVIENLQAINTALDQIDAVLAESPATGLDRQLLISMYADQLARLSSVQTLVMNSNQEILL